MSKRMLEFTVDIVLDTDTAILIQQDEREIWIPKSEIGETTQAGDSWQITLPGWFAISKGLV